MLNLKMSDRERRTLEYNLNYYKREKERMEQQFDRRRREILDQLRTEEPSMERARNMVTSMTELNNNYRWEMSRINSEIQNAQQALLSFNLQFKN
jgi:hypothetical protein